MLVKRTRASEVRVISNNPDDIQNILVVGPATATFVPHSRTKSGSTNLPEGVVHVYRDCDRRPDADSDKLASSSSARTVNLDDGVTLGVLAVPAWMTPSDFLAFVAPAAEGMAHLRLVRSAFLLLYRLRLIDLSEYSLQGFYA